jgi:hypothetical protein
VAATPGITVAVNVTDCPKRLGLAEEVTVVLVGAAVTLAVELLLLLLLFGSDVVVEIVTVLETLKGAVYSTFATSVKAAVAPAAKLAIEQLTVAPVVQVNIGPLV